MIVRMIKLISGGHYAEKGHCYCLYMTFPEFSKSSAMDIDKNEQKTLKVSLPNCIVLTRSKIYFNIVVRLFGFGIGLKIQSKV